MTSPVRRRSDLAAATSLLIAHARGQCRKDSAEECGSVHLRLAAMEDPLGAVVQKVQAPCDWLECQELLQTADQWAVGVRQGSSSVVLVW